MQEDLYGPPDNGVDHVENTPRNNYGEGYEKRKELFIIDGYRIWAYTEEEAQKQYQTILKF